MVRTESDCFTVAGMINGPKLVRNVMNTEGAPKLYSNVCPLCGMRSRGSAP